jgi:hypothetical protein
VGKSRKRDVDLDDSFPAFNKNSKKNLNRTERRHIRQILENYQKNNKKETEK